jgi:hypothetical protein
MFYDQISALHKSVRGSDPDAALYWLCRMIDGGCDLVYLSRRVVRMASEDIGNADPRGLTLALEAWDVYERLGSPRANWRWPRRWSTWPARPRATPCTRPTPAPWPMCANWAAWTCPCTCATPHEAHEGTGLRQGPTAMPTTRPTASRRERATSRTTCRNAVITCRWTGAWRSGSGKSWRICAVATRTRAVNPGPRADAQGAQRRCRERRAMIEGIA